MRRKNIKLCAPVTDIFLGIAKEVLPFIGAVEYKNSRYEVRFDKELDVLFESPLGIISDAWVEWMKKGRIRSFLRRTKPLSFSVDLGPACRRYRNRKGTGGILRSYPQSKVLSPEEIIALARKRVKQLRRYFTGTVKFEILNYYPTGAYEHVCNPAFIKKLLDATGGELLLDVAHARIASENLGIPFPQYLSQLPLEKVSEIHISKPTRVNGIWKDSHEKPGKNEFSLLKKLICKTKVRHVVIEYYKDKAVLKKLFRELYSLLSP